FVDTTPTGLLMIHGLDSTNHALNEHYDEIVAEMVRPDPQVVPDEILRRAGAMSPEELFALDIWAQLRAARPGGGQDAKRRVAIVPRRALKGPVDVVRPLGDPTPAAKNPAASGPGPARTAAGPTVNHLRSALSRGLARARRDR